jgi:glycogen(starch) synthase
MILFLGRLTWVKGVTSLVQAMPMALADDPKTKLAILGKGEQQNDTVETANRLETSGKVVCRFEFVPETERILHYAATDACIFPSAYEPFGIVSLQAMSMEKPIIICATRSFCLEKAL